MNFIYILLIFLALLLLCEIMAILLKLTGLEIEKARFQVISIITHTGFTTRESELIAQHPLRRKLVSYLMLVSYIGQATFFSFLISAIRDQGMIYGLIIACSIILLLTFLLRSRPLLSRIEPILDKFIARRLMKSISSRCIEKFLYMNDGFEVIEVVIKPQSKLCNIHLKNLTIDNIKVLLIDKGSEIIPNPKGSDIIEEGDRIIVYGKFDNIEDIF